METVSEIINITDKLAHFSEKETSSSSSSLISLECSNVLFTAKGLKKNISSYILLAIIFYFLLSIVAFIKCGFPSFKIKLNNILNNKANKSLNNIDNRQITNGKSFRYNNNNIYSKINKFKKFAPPKRSELRFLSNKFPLKRYHTLLKGSNIPIKGIIEYDVKNADMGNQSKNQLFNNNCLNNKLQIKKDTIPRKKFNENEYNFMTYEEAILYDYRTCFEYYKYLLKTKHPTLFGFCPLKDYNSMIIKSDILYLSFSIYYAINFFYLLKILFIIYSKMEENIIY